MSINSSNVPDPKYEVLAVKGLEIAYNLYPNNLPKRLERFAEIFSARYPSSVGWKVGQTCKKIYQYSQDKTRTYVDINVVNKTVNFIVKIFE